jgi:hypothetical protein
MTDESNRAELGSLIRAAQQAVQKSMDDVLEVLESSAPDGERLEELLLTFRDHAAAQYRLEEQGGLVDKKEVTGPGTVRQTDAMVERHRAIESRGEGLAQLAQRGDLSQASTLESLAGEVHLLFSDYGRQETAEIDLHQDLALRDTGGEE